MSKMIYLQLLRPKHYIKNLLCIVPLFFSGMLFQKMRGGVIAFSLFSLAASVVYIINDIIDADRDKQHPVKCKRPIASGKISKKNAFGTALLLCCVIAVLTFKISSIGILGLSYLVIYVAINVLYSVFGKNIPIIDTIILASGFLLRIFYGAYVCNIEISGWLALTVTAFALYMGLGKRRNELNKDQNGNSREVLKYYTCKYLDSMMQVFLTLGIAFYSLWSIDSQEIDMIGKIISILWVIYIIMNYSLVIEKRTFADPVEILCSSKALIISLLLYGVFMLFILYM